MSDYGMKVWDASGNLVLSTTDQVTRLVYTKVLSNGDGDGSIAIPAINGVSTVQFAYPMGTAGSFGIGGAYKITRASNTIYWYESTSSAFPSVDCILVVFAYD